MALKRNIMKLYNLKTIGEYYNNYTNIIQFRTYCIKSKAILYGTAMSEDHYIQ